MSFRSTTIKNEFTWWPLKQTAKTNGFQWGLLLASINLALSLFMWDKRTEEFRQKMTRTFNTLFDECRWLRRRDKLSPISPLDCPSSFTGLPQGRARQRAFHSPKLTDFCLLQSLKMWWFWFDVKYKYVILFLFLCFTHLVIVKLRLKYSLELFGLYFCVNFLHDTYHKQLKMKKVKSPQ